MSQTEPSRTNRILQSTGKGIRWFYFNGWKLVLGLVLVLVVCYSLTTYLLERRFVAEITTLRAQGQPVTAADLVRPAVPDKRNGAVVFAKAFKILESKDGEKATDTLRYMMSGKRPVAGKSKSATFKPPMPVLPMTQTPPGVPVMPPIQAPQRMEKGPTPWLEVIQAAKQVAGVVPITREVLSRPDCQFPMDTNPDSLATPKHYAGLRYLVSVLSALAVVDAHDGKMGQAIEKISLAFATAQVNRKEQSVVAVFRLLSYVEIANSGLQKVLEYGNPTPAQAAKLNRLLKSPRLESQLVYGLQGERALSLTMANRMYSILMPEGLKGISGGSSKDAQHGDSMLGYLLRPVAYFYGVTGLRVMSQTIAIAEKRYPNAKQQQDELNKVETSVPSYAPMVAAMIPMFTSVVMKPHATRAKTALTQILMAAQQYKASHSQYPETMALVRSMGISDIPMDPFNGKDFVYKRTTKGFKVYSVGEDFKDDGGKSKSERQRSEDGWDIMLRWER